MLMIQRRSCSGLWNIGRIKSWNSVASWPTLAEGHCDTFVPMRYTIKCFFKKRHITK